MTSPRRNHPKPRAKPARRLFLIGAGAGALGLAGVVGLGASKKEAKMDVKLHPEPDAKNDAMHLQIIAHPDDDLYFFNPELTAALRSAGRVVTICLTAGEADGKNMSASDPRFEDAEPRFTEYSAARYSGLRSSYAHQLTGDPSSQWIRKNRTLPNGAQVEVSSLIAAPHVELLFLNMWQSGARSPGGVPARLMTLWSEDKVPQPTMVPDGSPVTEVFSYSRRDLIDSLLYLIDHYQPTVIRTLDPDPDYQVHDAENPQYSDYGDFSDHIDHTPAALFAWAAIHEWCKRGHGKKTLVESYRGYFNRRWPANLGQAAAASKLKYLVTYGAGDGRACPDPTGCGDHKIGAIKSLTGYGQSTTHRYAVNTSWLQRRGDGRLAAFAVRGGDATMWTEKADRSGFSAPVSLGGARLLPHLAVVLRSDQRLQIFGVRMTLDPDPENQRRELVTAVQEKPNGPFGEWTELGNPNQHDAVKRRGIGMPAAACDGDGRVWVFVRNFHSGISGRSCLGGQWSDWFDLGSTGTQDGLTAITTPGGMIELFVSTKDGIRRFHQTQRGARLRSDNLAVAAPAGPPTVGRLGDGRLMLLVREAQTADALGYLQTRPDGAWNTVPVRMATHGGFGPIAFAAYENKVAVAHRNDQGRVSFSIRTDADLGVVHSFGDGTELIHTPSVAINGAGTPVLAYLNATGDLVAAYGTPRRKGGPVQGS